VLGVFSFGHVRDLPDNSRRRNQRDGDEQGILLFVRIYIESIVAHLLEGLLMLDPKDRLSAKEALAHPYFYPNSVKKIDWSLS